MDGKDIRFMSFAEAGHLLLNTAGHKISLGFVSAVQRGYEVSVSRPSDGVEPGPGGAHEIEEKVSITSFSSRSSASTPAEPNNSISIIARLDAEIIQLKNSPLSYVDISPINGTEPSQSNKSVSYSSIRSLNRSEMQESNQGLRPRDDDRLSARTPADASVQEQSALIKKLLEQNQTLITSLHEMRDKAAAADEKAKQADENARIFERRAKAAEARLAVIKTELGSLKQLGRLEEPAAQIHDSMLTPKQNHRATMPACIPEMPLLQNGVASVHTPSDASLHSSVSGRKHDKNNRNNNMNKPRSCNFVYMNCLAAYPRTYEPLILVFCI